MFKFVNPSFYEFSDLIIKCTHTNTDKLTTHKGELKIDTTFVYQYTADLDGIDLLNEC